jgi:hypothetical protein
MTATTQQELADRGGLVYTGLFECRCGQAYTTQRELLAHFTRRPNPTHQAARAAEDVSR